jgi:RNase H-fold protein (predicted Holliday junction resolvase)
MRKRTMADEIMYDDALEEAKYLEKRKQKIDGLAANIILQTYLDKEKGI